MSTKSPEEGKQFSLGGARQSKPVDDELTCPLTKEEVLQIEENLNSDRLTNIESILISIGAAMIISAIIYYLSTPFVIKIDVGNGKVIDSVCKMPCIVLGIYSVIGLSTTIGFLFLWKSKKLSKGSVNRLMAKILKHYDKE